jgi:hypothetical protein
VSPVKYELVFYIPQDDILHSHRRENFQTIRSSVQQRMGPDILPVQVTTSVNLVFMRILLKPRECCILTAFQTDIYICVNTIPNFTSGIQKFLECQYCILMVGRMQRILNDPSLPAHIFAPTTLPLLEAPAEGFYWILPAFGHRIRLDALQFAECVHLRPIRRTRNSQKSLGARSEEYGCCVVTGMLFFLGGELLHNS